MKNKQRTLSRVKTFSPSQPALTEMKKMKKRNPLHVETFHQTKSIILLQEQGTILLVKVYCNSTHSMCFLFCFSICTLMGTIKHQASVITLCFQAPPRGGAGAITAYTQQILPAPQLIPTVRTVLPAFFINRAHLHPHWYRSLCLLKHY